MPPRETLPRLRFLLQAIVAAGLAGTTLELVLLGHDEDALQFLPFAVMALSMMAVCGSEYRAALPRSDPSGRR